MLYIFCTDFIAGTASRPPKLTNSDVAAFLLGADESIVTYECRLRCASRDPEAYLTELSAGSLAFMSFAACRGKNETFQPCTAEPVFTVPHQ